MTGKMFAEAATATTVLIYTMTDPTFKRWESPAIIGLLAFLLARTDYRRKAIVLWMICTLPEVNAGNDDDGAPASRCPTFDRVAANFVAWLISFTAWLDWKAPELVPVLNGAKPPARPAPDDIDNGPPAEAKRKRRHCGAHHIDELCPRGQGGRLRDSLSDYARQLLEKQVARAGNSQGSSSDDRAYTTHRDDSRGDYTPSKRARSPTPQSEGYMDQGQSSSPAISPNTYEHSHVSSRR